MTYATWKDALEAMKPYLAQTSAEQVEIAAAAGVRLSWSIPHSIASVRLRELIRSHIAVDPARAPYSGKLLYMGDLAGILGKPVPRCSSNDEADAWIRYFYLLRRRGALRKLRLCQGDLVRRVSAAQDEVDEVVSIGATGTVYFKGGRAQAWPDTLTVVARANDRSKSAETARGLAGNRAAHRVRTDTWSLAKEDKLLVYRTDGVASDVDIEDLMTTIDEAEDEAPIQRFLTDRTHILTTLLGGHSRFCVPQTRVGTRYVADFFIADVNSSGIRWVLVELESPRSSVTLKTGNQFDAEARKGVSQIQEWREWLLSNLDHARRNRAENGLGLVDIRPEAEGLVIVGRRENLRPNAPALRDRLFETERIRMHTYDWLVDRLEAARRHGGAPGGNPHLLPR